MYLLGKKWNFSPYVLSRRDFTRIFPLKRHCRHSLCKRLNFSARRYAIYTYTRRQVENIDAQRQKDSGVASRRVASVLRRRARYGDRSSTLTKFSNTVIEVCDYADAWCTLVYRCSKTVEAEAVTALSLWITPPASASSWGFVGPHRGRRPEITMASTPD